MNNNKNQSGFYLLSDNTDAFVARLALTTMAEKTLDIQYYMMHNDASGQYLAYEILSSADRGVHVRILVDDINLPGSDNHLKILSQHENIEIRIFNALAHRDWFKNIELVINLKHAGRRMHNKTFVTDNTYAIIGGRNIGDEYFDARHGRNFVDLDLLCTGPIVDDITLSFNDYWSSPLSTPVENLSKVKVVKNQLRRIRDKLKDRWRLSKNTDYFRSLQHSDIGRKIIDKKVPFIQAKASLFYDIPEKICSTPSDKSAYLNAQITPYLEQSENELLIVSPYFVPGTRGSSWFRNKQRQGVNINILTNSLAATDVSAVHAGYKKYRRELIDAGINLFELKIAPRSLLSKTRQFIRGSSRASLHAKYMIIDQHYVFIGSANLDPRSRSLNTEIGILIDSDALAWQATQLFSKATSLKNSYKILTASQNNELLWLTEEKDEEVLYHHEPEVSFLKKLSVYILGLLPIESLL